MSLDLNFVRQQFPALHQDNTIYMDNAGGSLVLQRVADLVQDYLLHHSVQHGASYQKSQQASGCLRQAQESVASLINAKRPEECILGSSTTASLRMLATAFGKKLQAGDEIIVTDSDHESNIGAWTALEAQGIVIKTWPINPETYLLDLELLKPLISQRTRLICFTHTSNLLGMINPIEEITEFVHSHNIQVCVDGVAYAPHRLVDVQAWDVDYYVFSFYKVYGPHHSVLYGKHENLLDLPNVNHYFVDEAEIPYKFQPGSPNYELSYGCVGILDYLVELGKQAGYSSNENRDLLAAAFEDITRHEVQLSEQLLSYLNNRQDVRVIGADHADPAFRLPTISFVVEGWDSAKIVKQMDTFSIGIRFGDFYARRLVERLGLASQNGVVRVSMVHYNTQDEVTRLTDAFDQILS